VQITGARMPGKWLLTVRDSGPGFSDAVLQELRERIEQADCQIGMPIMEISGLGILNVYLRWKLFCGDDSVFDFGNLPEGGCFVQFGQKTPDEEREA
jgi:two-component system sensor histidine kinase YesM